MKLQKKIFILNGVQRNLYIKEGESLAELLRRYGMTSVKIGCGIGVCGSCTVLLDGKPVRSCNKKVDSIPEFSTIETAEGLGTAENMHPLQAAFLTRGSVQCGFCTPGMLMSAKALLDQNPDPTRQEVRDWFTKNHNICRCTGYKQIVDAVIDAAKVMRGEEPFEFLEFKQEGDSIYGTDYPRPFAKAAVMGVADYGEDVGDKFPEETLHLAPVFAEVGAGKLLGLDIEEASKAEGVVKVITAADIKGTNNIFAPVGHPRSKAVLMERDIITKEIIRKKGDVLAVVAADTREHARKAAALIKADIEEWPANESALDSVKPGATQVQADSPNHFITLPVFKGEETGPIFDEAPYVVEGSFSSTREPHMPIEPHSMQAFVDSDGVLNVCIKSQFLHIPTFALPAALGIAPEKVRIINNAVGGLFGLGMSPDSAAIVGAASLALDGQPVTLTLTYREFQLFSGKRSASFSNGRLAADKDGHLLACDIDMAFDHGAYPETAGILQSKGMRFICYGLKIPNIRAIGRGILSNNSYAIPYRSFGSPQMYTISDQLIDMMAKKIGMDPFEFLELNAIEPGDTTANSRPYHYYSVRALLEKMKPYWEECLEWKKQGAAEGKVRGIGVAMGGFHVSEDADSAEVWLELNEDGTVTNYNCWQEMGQGGDASCVAFTVEALKPLGIKPEQVRLDKDDTGRAPFHGPSAASRSHYVSGNATMIAGQMMLDAMRKEDGTYRTYAEMKEEGIDTIFKATWSSVGEREALNPDTGEGNPMMDHNHIVQIAKIEADPETGKVDVVAVHAAADVGVIGNVLTIEGQAVGGLAHAIGFALSEDYSDFDKKYENMIGCGMLSCNDIPDDVAFEYVETPRDGGPLGSGGASECFQSCGHASILNAINDALDIRIYELPASPDKIKDALKCKAEGKDNKPEKWNLGDSFEDVIQEIRDNPKADPAAEAEFDATKIM